MNTPRPQRTFRILTIGLGGLAILLGGVVLGLFIVVGAPWDGGGSSGVGNVEEPSAPVVDANEDPPGVSDSHVVFGQSAALSGPASGLGLNMRRGIEAAFYEANLSGGVHGRQLALISMDDAYEPDIAITNTIDLIEEKQVFALIGAVGTPTSRSAAPIASEAGVPYLAPFTGADFLRDASRLNTVINLRASYNQEAEEMVERLTKDLGIRRIGLLYQDDSFGRAGYRGVTAALDRRGMSLVSTGVYPRNTTAVKTALLDIWEGRPEAVILIGAYEPIATVISWARRTEMDSVFMTLSFVGGIALAQELGPYGSGVYVTQVVPSPKDNSIPVVSTYFRALSLYDPSATPDFVSFEGYLAGRLAIAGIQSCGSEVNRECFFAGIRGSGVINLDGFELVYGVGDNQGSDAIFLSVIGSDGQYHSVDSLKDEVP